MVNINQLFLKKPPLQLVNKMLKNLGLSSLRDKTIFTIESMSKYNTLSKMQDDIKIIQEYYLPCKTKLYLTNLNLKKCITIVRQLIKLYDYDIISMEKSVNNTKFLLYHLVKKCDKNILLKKKTKKKRHEYIINFD